MTRVPRVGQALLASLLLFVLSAGTAGAARPDNAQASNSASLDSAARAAAVSLAGEILILAKHPVPHEHFTLLGAYTSYYEVSVVIASSGPSPYAHAQKEHYALYADFPRPPGSQERTVRASDLSKLVARNTVEVVVNGGGQLILSRNSFRPFIDGGPPQTLNPGWIFHGNYGTSSSRVISLGASTRPRTHELLFNLDRIKAVRDQAKALINEAKAAGPMSPLLPPFNHMPGKGAPLPPPIF